jgi:hypothetical protein
VNVPRINKDSFEIYPILLDDGKWVIDIFEHDYDMSAEISYEKMKEIVDYITQQRYPKLKAGEINEKKS